MAFATEKQKQLRAALELASDPKTAADKKQELLIQLRKEGWELKPEPKSRQAAQQRAEAKIAAKAEEKEEERELSDWQGYLNNAILYLKLLVPNFRPEMLSTGRTPALFNVRAMQILMLTAVANQRISHLQSVTQQVESGYGFSSAIVPPWMQTSLSATPYS